MGKEFKDNEFKDSEQGGVNTNSRVESDSNKQGSTHIADTRNDSTRDSEQGAERKIKNIGEGISKEVENKIDLKKQRAYEAERAKNTQKSSKDFVKEAKKESSSDNGLFMTFMFFGLSLLIFVMYQTKGIFFDKIKSFFTKNTTESQVRNAEMNPERDHNDLLRGQS